MFLLVLAIVAGVVVYLVYTSVKKNEEKVKLEEEKKKKQAAQQARAEEARKKCWASLPAFYATIPRQNLPHLLRALENREYIDKKYPINRAVTGVNPEEIGHRRLELIWEIEEYSGKSLLEFSHADLHIKYLKQILGKK